MADAVEALLCCVQCIESLLDKGPEGVAAVLGCRGMVRGLAGLLRPGEPPVVRAALDQLSRLLRHSDSSYRQVGR